MIKRLRDMTRNAMLQTDPLGMALLQATYLPRIDLTEVARGMELLAPTKELSIVAPLVTRHAPLDLMRSRVAQ
jgi:hypothetical protein